MSISAAAGSIVTTIVEFLEDDLDNLIEDIVSDKLAQLSGKVESIAAKYGDQTFSNQITPTETLKMLKELLSEGINCLSQLEVRVDQWGKEKVSQGYDVDKVKSVAADNLGLIEIGKECALEVSDMLSKIHFIKIELSSDSGTSSFEGICYPSPSQAHNGK